MKTEDLELKNILLWLGSFLFMSGIMFFFAFNWDELHKFIKLSFVPILIIGIIIIHLNSLKKSLISHITLWMAIVAIGIEFAIFGQVYQTGADAYSLFVAWCVFSFGFVVVSSSSIIWFTYLILLNTSISLYMTQSLHTDFNDNIAVSIIFNIFTLCILYFLILKKKLLNFNWIYKLNYIYLILLLTILLMIEFIDTFSFYSLFILVYLALIYYNKEKNDILTEALSMFTLVFLLSAFSSNITSNGGGKVYLSVLIFIISSVRAVKYIINKFKKKNISLSFEKLPWMAHIFIFVLSIFSAIGIIVFASVAGILNTPEGILIMSLTIFSIALFLRKKQHSSLNWYYGFLVAIILSQIGIFIGLNELVLDYKINIFNIKLAMLVIGTIQVLLFVMIKDYIHRILNIVIFCLSIVFIQTDTLSYYALMLLLVFLTLFIIIDKYFKKPFLRLTQTINDGFIVSIFILSLLIIFKDTSLLINTLVFQIFSSILLLYVIYESLKINKQWSVKIMAILLLTTIATSYIPPLNSILVLLIISLHIKNKYLSMLSIIVIIICISRWYYNIELSLLFKSIYMICAGLAMITSYYFMNKRKNLCEI